MIRFSEPARIEVARGDRVVKGKRKAKVIREVAVWRNAEDESRNDHQKRNGYDEDDAFRLRRAGDGPRSGLPSLDDVRAHQINAGAESTAAPAYVSGGVLVT